VSDSKNHDAIFPAGEKTMSQEFRYNSVVVASIALSLGGVAVGAWVTKPDDGGRGGAIAVALAFLILFVRRNYGARVYDALTKDIPSLRDQIISLRQGKEPLAKDMGDTGELRRQLIAMVSRLDIEADGQNRQNRALAWASCIGTIAWGFGDIFARHLQNITGR
jgi:hypothetical protein